MARCAYCGKPLVADAHFCMWCGHEVENAQSEADVEAALSSLDANDVETFDVLSGAVARAAVVPETDGDATSVVDDEAAVGKADDEAAASEDGDDATAGVGADESAVPEADDETTAAEAVDGVGRGSDPSAAGGKVSADAGPTDDASITSANTETDEGATNDADGEDDSQVGAEPEASDVEAPDAKAPDGKTDAAPVPSTPTYRRKLNLPTIATLPDGGAPQASHQRSLNIPQVAPAASPAISAAQTRVWHPIAGALADNQVAAGQLWQGGDSSYASGAARSYANPLVGNAGIYGTSPAGRVPPASLNDSRTTVLDPVRVGTVNSAARPTVSRIDLSEQRTSIMTPIDQVAQEYPPATPDLGPGSTRVMPAIKKQQARDAAPLPSPVPKRHPVLKGIAIGVLIAAVFWIVFFALVM